MIRIDDKNFENKVNQPQEGVYSDPNLDEFWWDQLPETTESTPFYPVMGAPVAACCVSGMSLEPLAQQVLASSNATALQLLGLPLAEEKLLAYLEASDPAEMETLAEQTFVAYEQVLDLVVQLETEYGDLPGMKGKCQALRQAIMGELLAKGGDLIARFGNKARDILEALCCVVEDYGRVCVAETPAPAPEICVAAEPEAECAPRLPEEEPAPPVLLTEEEKSAKEPAEESADVPVIDLSGGGSYFPPSTVGGSTSSPENTAAVAYEEFTGPLARTVQEEFLDMQYRNERAAMKQFFAGIMKKLSESGGTVRKADYGYDPNKAAA